MGWVLGFWTQPMWTQPMGWVLGTYLKKGYNLHKVLLVCLNNLQNTYITDTYDTGCK